jgi:hypothetical protein
VNNRTAALAALSLVATLLTGCGRPIGTTPAAMATAPAPAQSAVRAAAVPALPTHLVIDDVTVTRTERNERITIKAHSDTQKETLVFSSFFPYYVPMYGAVIRNGRTITLDRAVAVPLDKLLHAADTTGLSDRAKQGLRTALYGLDFKARHWDNGDRP